MARLESEGKGGFYPTPPEEMVYILKRLSANEGETISLLDPCCGKGAALYQFKDDMKNKGAKPISYGIEIEKSRAKEAENNVDHLIACGYEEARISHEAFSAMYLNPPFMHGNKERTELTFLRDLTADYLQPGGVLILNIPQYVLKDCAKLIASRFQNIKVYRFTDRNYDSYRQVIVYGTRRRKGLRTDSEREYQHRMERELYNLGFLEKRDVPSLDTEDWKEVQYTIPTQENNVDIFQSLKVEPEDILNSLQECEFFEQECEFFEKVEKKITDLSITGGKQISPATNLKTTHVATAIASGALPEEMGDHLLVGVTKRVKEEKSQINPKTGKTQQITTLKPKSIVRVFSDKGIFDLK